MPSEVGITLGIRQAWYDQPITWPKLHSTTLSQGMTLRHNLLVSLHLGGEGDVLILHSGVFHDFLRLLDLVCMQGTERANSFVIPSSSQAVSQVDSIISSTGIGPTGKWPLRQSIGHRGFLATWLLHDHR
jgi:hypothetical protein